MDLLAKQFLFYLLSTLRVQCHRGLGKPRLFSVYHEELAFYSLPGHNVDAEHESLSPLKFGTRTMPRDDINRHCCGI